MSKAANRKIAGKHGSHRKKDPPASRRWRQLRSEYELRHQEPDDWWDAENERLTDEQHEPIAKDEA